MINISGISESRVAPVAAYLSGKGQSLMIVPTETRAKRMASDLSFLQRTGKFTYWRQRNTFF